MAHMYSFPTEYVFPQSVWFEYSKFCENLIINFKHKHMGTLTPHPIHGHQKGKKSQSQIEKEKLEAFKASEAEETKENGEDTSPDEEE